MAQYKVRHVLEESEEPLFEAACRALVGTAAPFIASCFARVYHGGSPLLDVPRAMGPLAPPSAAPTPPALSAQPSATPAQLRGQGDVAEDGDADQGYGAAGDDGGVPQGVGTRVPGDAHRQGSPLEEPGPVNGAGDDIRL